MLKKRQLGVEAGAEGLTAAAPFSSLAASSLHRRGQLPLHALLSKMCDKALPHNQRWQGKSIREMAEAQGKGIIDGFLDLVVEEHLETVFLEGSSNVDKVAMAQILTYPNAYIGLSDGAAHVQFHGGYGYSTRLLGYWVRQEGIMSLEQAVRRLTFESASTFGIYDRGVVRPGVAAGIPIFFSVDINPLPGERMTHLPVGCI